MLDFLKKKTAYEKELEMFCDQEPDFYEATDDDDEFWKEMILFDILEDD